MVFCDWLSHSCHVFKNHPYYSMYQYFITFYCQVMFHCKDITYIIYSFINWWILVDSTFWLLWIMLRWTFKFLCGHMFLFLLSILFGMKFPSQNVTVFYHLRNCQTVLQSGCNILHSFLPAMCESFKLFTSLSDFSYSLTFWLRLP